MFGVVRNCDGSSVWEQASARHQQADARLEALRANASTAECDPDILGDACDILEMALGCLGAAQDLALSQAGVSLPTSPDPGGWANDFLSSLGSHTSGLTSAFFNDAATALGVARGAAQAASLYLDLNEAYSQCGL